MGVHEKRMHGIALQKKEKDLEDFLSKGVSLRFQLGGSWSYRKIMKTFLCRLVAMFTCCISTYVHKCGYYEEYGKPIIICFHICCIMLCVQFVSKCVSKNYAHTIMGKLL